MSVVTSSRAVLLAGRTLLLLHLSLVHAQNLAGIVKNARSKGLTGYDLIDACDVWYGRNGAPYHIPKQLIDLFGNKDGRATIEDWLKGGLPAEHFRYFDKDSNGVLDEPESCKWFFQRKSARTMNLSEIADPPRGHLQHLGGWKDPLPSEDLVYTKPYPHPREFWAKHMDGYLPAVLKGAQHGWPAMNWTRESLDSRFGWVDTKLEPKVEGRGNDTAYRELDAHAPRHRLNISEYLRMEQGKNMYVVSILPQAMAWEVAHPSVLLCGSRKTMLNKKTPPPYKKRKHEYPNEFGYPWMTHVFEANLWMASGFTRSQFHYDKEWNVNCLLAGKKRWFFLNPFLYDEDLHWARGKQFEKLNPLNNHWTDWVYLDPDAVDLIAQHKLRHMDYYELIQEAGDCIFIPYAMLHQVEKIGDDMQVAASWMFLPESIYDEEDCKDAPLQEDLPLGVMDVLYAYSGKGLIPQGYPDPLEIARNLGRAMEAENEDVLTHKRFKKYVSQGDAVLATAPDRKVRIKKLFELLKSYAKDPAKGLTRDELMTSVPLRVWCKPASEGDQEGPLPCDHGEEYDILDNKEVGKMKAYIDSLPKGAAASSEPASKLKRTHPVNRRAYVSRPGRNEL